ncbi:MAG: ABC transporter permease [Opitutaceae bacterium]|nr:ABC transporter permease [Opitutaceae bacterium]
MRRLRSLFFRIGAFARRRSLEAEMNAELQAHLEDLTERHLAAGLTPTEARQAAQREFGGVAQLQEQARDARSVVWLEHLVRDFGYAVRSLRKNPGFTFVVAFTLALGLGVNTALFTWFNAAAFRPLPVAESEKLFTITRLDGKGNETKAMSHVDFVTYREHQSVFSGLAAADGIGVEPADAAEYIDAKGVKSAGFRVETVSPNYFAVLGVPMALGRPLIPSDENASRALPVIVLSHQFWQNYLGGDPNVIGRTLRFRGLAEEALSVVGVAGPDFYGTKPGARMGWVPMLMRPGESWRTDLTATNFTLTGRLRAGISPEQAAEELRSIANTMLVRRHEGARTGEVIVLTKASSYLNLSTRNLLLLLPLVCMFGAVFVISCANASNLILARSMTRQFEFAVRSALGATRRRLLALLVTESVVLGLLGGILGWALAAAMLRFVWPWLLDMQPYAREGTAGLVLTADYRVFAFTTTVSVLAGLAGGLLPALHVTRRNVLPALNREGSVFGRGVRLSRVRNVLVVAQLALSSALIFIAGLLVHRALRTQFYDHGIDKSRLLTMEVMVPRTFGAGQIDAARRQAWERVRALSEVAMVCETPQFPFGSKLARVSVRDTPTGEARLVQVRQLAVSAGYFTTLQLPLVQGRYLNRDEIPDDRVAVISEATARALWPGRDALGQHFDVPLQVVTGSSAEGTERQNEGDAPATTLTVIGIVRDTRVYDPWESGGPIVFLPAPPPTQAGAYLLIRTVNVAEGSVATLHQVGRDVTGMAPRLQTVNDLFAQAYLQYRVVAWVASILAGLSLVVAVIGLYGVMSYAVNQRVKEIGIRVALGASPRRVASGVVLETLRLVAWGTVVGYALSVVLAVFARVYLFGVSPFDPVACGLVALFLAVVGLLACWIPARRAARVNPVVALRAE